MTTPRLPSVDVTVAPAPVVAPHHTDDVVYMVGAADASGSIGEGPSTPTRSISTIQGLIGSQGVLYDNLVVMLNAVDTRVSFAATPGRITQTTAAINDSDTTVTVQEVSGYAAGMSIRVDAEIMQIQSISGSTLTVTRASAGTTAVGHVDGATVFPIPTNDQTIAALNQANAVNQLITVLAAPGRQRGVNGASTSANAVNTHLNVLANQLECKAVSRTVQDVYSNMLVWAMNNYQPNVMLVGNVPNEGAWLGAALAVTGQYGRQRGIEHAPLLGTTELPFRVTYSPRRAVSSQAETLVEAFLSIGVERNGRKEIVGHTFHGVTDTTRYWSVARVIDHVKHALEIAGEAHIGAGNTELGRAAVASDLETVGRQSVRAGELRSFNAIVSPDRNTPETEAQGIAAIDCAAGTIVPVSTIPIRLDI